MEHAERGGREGGGGNHLGRAQRQARTLTRTAAAETVDPDRLTRGQRGQGDQQARIDLVRTLTTLTTRSDWSRLTRVAIWAARD